MDDTTVVTDISKALADPTRLKIVRLLSETAHPLCVNAITQKLSVSQSAVSQHLRVLRQAGLAEGNRYGYHVHYVLNRAALNRYREAIGELVAEAEEPAHPS